MSDEIPNPKYMSPEDIEPNRIDFLNNAFNSLGRGGFNNQIGTFMSEIDRFKVHPIPANNEMSGITFITRPHLNLSDPNLRRHRVLAPYLSNNPVSLAFALKCWMDPRYARSTSQIASKADTCPCFTAKSPWFMPMMNGLKAITGFPDPYIDTFSYPKGFHGEDMTVVAGGDDMNQTYDLSLTFEDPQFGPLAGGFLLWLTYMRLVTKGLIMARKKDIENRVMEHTVSIYRFVLDPTRRYITRYARAAMCFPKSLPYGAMMAVNDGEKFVSSIGKFTVPFAANMVKYDDFAIFEDFNILARRYFPDIDTLAKTPGNYTTSGGMKFGDTESVPESYFLTGNNADSNFSGLPYIVPTSYGNELRFVYPKPEDIIAKKEKHTV